MINPRLPALLQGKTVDLALASAQVHAIGGDTWLIERVPPDANLTTERPEPIIAGVITSDATLASNTGVAVLVAEHGRIGAPAGGYATQTQTQRYSVGGVEFRAESDWEFTTTAELQQDDTLKSVLVAGHAFLVLNPGRRAGYTQAAIEEVGDA